MRTLLLVAFVLGLGAGASLPRASAGLYPGGQSLTAAEKRLAILYFWQLPAVKGASDFARAESSARYAALAGEHDQRDAYRHSTWNASMTRRFDSREAAERWGNAHEEKTGNPAASKAMDLSNNRSGREAAWAARKPGSWWKKASYPDDAGLAAITRDALEQGRLLMIEELGGRRDAQQGRLVPTTKP